MHEYNESCSIITHQITPKRPHQPRQGLMWMWSNSWVDKSAGKKTKLHTSIMGDPAWKSFLLTIDKSTLKLAQECQDIQVPPTGSPAPQEVWQTRKLASFKTEQQSKQRTNTQYPNSHTAHFRCKTSAYIEEAKRAPVASNWPPPSWWPLLRGSRSQGEFWQMLNIHSLVSIMP